MKLELQAVLPRGFTALRHRIATLGCCLSLFGCATTQNAEPGKEPAPRLLPLSAAARGQGVARWSPVEAEVASWLKNREYPWVVDWWGLARADRITSEWTRADDGALSVRVWVSRGFTATSIDLFFDARARDTVVTSSNGPYSALVEVAHHSDDSAPAAWQAPRGKVLMSHNPWQWAEFDWTFDLLISFDLSDCSGASPVHVQGIVNLKKP